MGNTLDKNSFSFVTGTPTALSTEDFYEDHNKAWDDYNDDYDDGSDSPLLVIVMMVMMMDMQVTSVYYKEMAELLKKATGAEHVEMFHHQVPDREHDIWDALRKYWILIWLKMIPTE